MARHQKRKKPIRYYSAKRRAVYAQGEEIDSLILFEQHGWICYNCKGKINKNLRMPNYYAATVEHIIPISRGGTHTWNNVAPSHAICNFIRGNSMSEQGLDSCQEHVLDYAE